MMFSSRTVPNKDETKENGDSPVLSDECKGKVKGLFLSLLI